MPENLMNPNHKASTDAYRDGWDRVFACKHENRIFEGSHICEDCGCVIQEEEGKD